MKENNFDREIENIQGSQYIPSFENKSQKS